MARFSRMAAIVVICTGFVSEAPSAIIIQSVTGGVMDGGSVPPDLTEGTVVSNTSIPVFFESVTATVTGAPSVKLPAIGAVVLPANQAAQPIVSLNGLTDVYSFIAHFDTSTGSSVTGTVKFATDDPFTEAKIVGFEWQNNGPLFLQNALDPIFGAGGTIYETAFSRRFIQSEGGSDALTFTAVDEIAIGSTTGAPFTDNLRILVQEVPGPAIPEPSTFGLAALGLLSLGLVGCRRRRRA